METKTYRPHLSTASDARAVRTRAALREALLSLLESRAMAEITIRDITERAGINYTTFLRHHETKESVLDELAAEELRRLVTLTAPMVDGRGALAAAKLFLGYVDEQRALWSTLLTGGAAATVREQFLRISTEIGHKQPRVSTWPPADIATLLVVGGTLEVLQWWLRQDEPAPIDEVARILDEIVIMPIVSRTRAKRRRSANASSGRAPSRKAGSSR
jgi:AcrR family transcriptional regulator